MNEIEVLTAYICARYKFVWDEETIKDYIEVLMEVVRLTINDISNNNLSIKSLVSPEIGFFTDDKSFEGKRLYCLYITHTKTDWYKSLYAQFKNAYRISVFADISTFPFGFNERSLRAIDPEATDEQIKNKMEIVNKRKKLARRFETLANKSLNRNRLVKPRTRFLIFQRDKFTCQTCGRKAPEVKLHLDHIIPVSSGERLTFTDNPNDYQTLCEECNLGKGNLLLMNLD